MNDAEIDSMVRRLFGLYLKLGEKGRLSKATLAALIGVSGSRFSQLCKDADGKLPTSAFLKMRSRCYAIQTALASGHLPASALRGKPQQDAISHLESL